jgi:hypothetical protein
MARLLQVPRTLLPERSPVPVPVPERLPVPRIPWVRPVV